MARTAPLQLVNYTKFDRTKDITEGDYKLTMDYGPFKDRKKTVLEYQNTVTQTRYYSGSYEKTVTATGTQEVHYISCGNGVNIAYVIEGSTGSYHYLHSDYLGSILAVSDASGNLEYEQNFDAWGRDRNPADWTYTASTNPRPSWLYRGFTGHEHLREFTLINMNARMYDTETGRMLAVDNYVSDPYNSQVYNRYSYANNNPLKFTDPSGEFGVLAAVAIGAVVGAYIGGSSANGTFNPGKWDYSSSQTYWGMGIGAVTGSLGGFAFMSGQSTSFVGGFGDGAASGFSSGFVTGYVTGSGSQKDRLMSGLRYGITSAALQGTANGIVGARHAKNLGLRGWDGALVETVYDYRISAPTVGQIGVNDCWPSCIESVDNSFGGSLTQQQVRNWYGGDEAIEDNKVLMQYQAKTGHGVSGLENRSIENLIDELDNNNNRAIVNMTKPGGTGHVAVVTSIYRTKVTMPNNTVRYSSYSIGVMDPGFTYTRSYSRHIGQRTLWDAKKLYLIKK